MVLRMELYVIVQLQIEIQYYFRHIYKLRGGMNSERNNKNNGLLLTVTTPTTDLSNPSFFEHAIRKDSSYQLIPSHIGILTYGIQELLSQIIKNKDYQSILIDISLPFHLTAQHNQKPKAKSIYFGRYLIFNKKILGIRLCYSVSQYYRQNNIEGWPKNRYEEIEFPHWLKKLYRDQNILMQPYKIPIGDFMLYFDNAKIALGFQSEFTEANRQIQEICQMDFNILSIVNDLPRSRQQEKNLNGHNYKNSSPFEAQLKRQSSSRNDFIVIYSGIRLAPLKELFFCNSFIWNRGKQYNQKPYFFNDGTLLSVFCSVQDRHRFVQKQLMVSRSIVKINTSLKQSQVKFQIQNFQINRTKYAQLTQFPKQFKNEIRLQKLFKYWYLYKQINKQNPFIISLPLTQSTAQLLTHIKRISKWSKKELKDLIIFYQSYYNKQSNVRIPQAIVVPYYKNIKELLDQKKYKNHYVYASQYQQIARLRIQYINSQNIFLCHNYLTTINTFKVKAISDGKLIETAQEIVRQNMKDMSDVYGMIKDFTNQQKINLLFIHLKRILLFQSSDINAFYQFIKYASREKIQEQLGETQIRTYNNYTQIDDFKQVSSKNLSMKRKNEFQKGQPQKQKFKSLLQSLKKSRQKFQGRQFQKCHACKLLTERGYYYECSGCKNITCYQCISTYLPSDSHHESAFNKCIVCLSECRCSICKNKFQIESKKKLQILMEDILQQRMVDKKRQQNADLAQNASAKTINQRKQQMNILVFCNQCKGHKNYLSLSSRDKSKVRDLNWICHDCEIAKLQRQHFQQVFRQANMMKDVQINKNTSKDPQLQRISSIQNGSNKEPIKQLPQNQILLKNINETKIQHVQSCNSTEPKQQILFKQKTRPYVLLPPPPPSQLKIKCPFPPPCLLPLNNQNNRMEHFEQKGAQNSYWKRKEQGLGQNIKTSCQSNQRAYINKRKSQRSQKQIGSKKQPNNYSKTQHTKNRDRSRSRERYRSSNSQSASSFNQLKNGRNENFRDKKRKKQTYRHNNKKESCQRYSDLQDSMSHQFRKAKRKQSFRQQFRPRQKKIRSRDKEETKQKDAQRTYKQQRKNYEQRRIEYCQNYVSQSKNNKEAAYDKNQDYSLRKQNNKTIKQYNKFQNNRQKQESRQDRQKSKDKLAKIAKQGIPGQISGRQSENSNKIVKEQKKVGLWNVKGRKRSESNEKAQKIVASYKSKQKFQTRKQNIYDQNKLIKGINMSGSQQEPIEY